MLTKPDRSAEKIHESSNGAKSLDETVLWDNFKNGNELAFSILYKRYVQRLYNYGMHNCRDKDLVLDCVQELFTHLWERRETVSSVGSVNFYLLKSFRRLIASKIVAQKKFFTPFPQNSSHHFEFIPSAEQFFIDGELKSQQTEGLKNGMKALSKRQREALFLPRMKRVVAVVEQMAEQCRGGVGEMPGIVQVAAQDRRDRPGLPMPSLLVEQPCKQALGLHEPVVARAVMQVHVHQGHPPALHVELDE
jgi:DNA-directed RNA polymerase specialized sigma24 family protein